MTKKKLAPTETEFKATECFLCGGKAGETFEEIRKVYYGPRPNYRSTKIVTVDRMIISLFDSFGICNKCSPVGSFVGSKLDRGSNDNPHFHYTAENERWKKWFAQHPNKTGTCNSFELNALPITATYTVNPEPVEARPRALGKPYCFYLSFQDAKRLEKQRQKVLKLVTPPPTPAVVVPEPDDWDV